MGVLANLRTGLIKIVSQMTADEMDLIDKIVRKKGKTPTHALRCVNAIRKKEKVRPLGKHAVHRYVGGDTHRRDATESRGRKRALSPCEVRKLDRARRRLIKKAKTEKRVTYANVVEEAGLEGRACERVCADALRGEGVAFRPPRNKIYVSEQDAQRHILI